MAKPCQIKRPRGLKGLKASPERGRRLCPCKSVQEHMTWLGQGAGDHQFCDREGPRRHFPGTAAICTHTGLSPQDQILCNSDLTPTVQLQDTVTPSSFSGPPLLSPFSLSASGAGDTNVGAALRAKVCPQLSRPRGPALQTASTGRY